MTSHGGLLDGRTAVVTGVGPGMGRAIALAFAREGADLALGARSRARLDEVASECRALGRRVVVRETDLTSEASCAALVDAAASELGRIDALVQNGHHEGDWVRGADADAASWRHVMEVNFFGALQLVRACAPHLRKSPAASIVLVNSGAAVRAPATMGAYSASKAALASLACTLANELGPDGIRVNGAYLGPVLGDNLARTGAGAAAAAGSTLDEWLAAKAREIPLRRIPTPEQCAGAILFLCSDLAAAVTGQNIAVNGGQWTTQ